MITKQKYLKALAIVNKYLKQNTPAAAPPAVVDNLKSYKLKVAVIIFHKNIDRYPKGWTDKCIDSIKNQTRKDFDVFEIDYGGDGTNLYKGSNFQSFKLENHAQAHNYLLDKVFKLGYDCAFNVNIDDWYTPDRFERQLPFISQGYDIVSSNFHCVDESGNIINTLQMHDKRCDTEASNDHNIIAHPVVCYSKNFWLTCEKLKPEEIPVDDFKMWKRAYNSGQYKFMILPDYLLYYRVHDQKVSK